MKYAIISDVHSNLLALQLAIKDAIKEKVDKFIFLGDYITDGYQDNEVIKLIKTYGNYVIKGNREAYVLDIVNNNKSYNHIINEKPIFTTKDILTEENIEYIKSLKENMIITIDDIKVLLIHGKFQELISPQNLEILDQLISHFDFDICLSGHTHTVEKFIYKNHYFLNPGSIGQPNDGPHYKYIILEVTRNQINTNIKKFPVIDTYKQLEEEYKKSKFYEENSIYSELIMKSIKEGNNEIITQFIDEFKKLASKKSNEESLIIWNELWKKKKDSLESKNNL